MRKEIAMYRILSLLMLIFVFSVHAVSAVDKAADKQKNLTATIEEVRESLSEKLGKTIPSINVLINTPEGLYYASVGQEEFKTTPKTNFRFASNTKNFTAAAILKMQQDKLLDIDQHITENILGTITPPGNPQQTFLFQAGRESPLQQHRVLHTGRNYRTGLFETYRETKNLR